MLAGVYKISILKHRPTSQKCIDMLVSLSQQIIVIIMNKAYIVRFLDTQHAALAV